MSDKVVIYGIVTGELIFIRKERVEELAGVFETMMSAKTWGEFRKKVSKEIYEMYLTVSTYYQGPYKTDDIDLSLYYIPDEKPFTPNDIFTYDNPPGHPEIEMSTWVPEDIQKKYGNRMKYYAMDGNVPPGDILELDVDRMDEIVKAMESHGFKCVRDDAMIEKAFGLSFNSDDYPDVPYVEEEEE